MNLHLLISQYLPFLTISTEYNKRFFHSQYRVMTNIFRIRITFFVWPFCSFFGVIISRQLKYFNIIITGPIICPIGWVDSIATNSDERTWSVVLFFNNFFLPSNAAIRVPPWWCRVLGSFSNNPNGCSDWRHTFVSSCKLLKHSTIVCCLSTAHPPLMKFAFSIKRIPRKQLKTIYKGNVK